MYNIRALFFTIVSICFILVSSSVFSSNRVAMYEVTITNITSGQTFTPIMLSTHARNVSLFKLGAPASQELSQLAESGDINPLVAKLVATNASTTTNGSLLAPGKSVTLRIRSSSKNRFLSVAAMLIPTNDAFFALNRIRLPKKVGTYYAVAYDAGSEVNDELCNNIPGPHCKGEGSSPGSDGEGFVHVHTGIHGVGDLKSIIYDWRNPTARIVIKRIR